MRLVQLSGRLGRRVAVVEEPRLRLLERCATIYDLASDCLREGSSLLAGVEERHPVSLLDYDAIYQREF